MGLNTGIILFNLGTPEEPSTEKVKVYLKEFLMDEDVIDIPFIPRWLLVNQIILRTRPSKSAEAYQKIWTERGSPLRYHSTDLVTKLASLFKTGHHVELAMRYGSPSLETAMKNFMKLGVNRLVVFPLYPQYAKASVGSSLKQLTLLKKKLNWEVETTIVPPFYQSPHFIDAWKSVAKPYLDAFKPDHVLMSFHGLPERHVKETDLTGKHCLASVTCCESIVEANKNCYRAQSFATARALAQSLNLKKSDYTVSFQSRLGRTPWIKPYTDLVFSDLSKRGVKRLAVMCPAFVADCLETLEEIGIRGKESFKKFGGEDLCLIPSLNSHDLWVDAVHSLLKERITEWIG